MDNINYSVCETTGELKTTFNIPIRFPDEKEDKKITSTLKNNKKKNNKKKGRKKKIIRFIKFFINLYNFKISHSYSHH